ncbi:MAG TPA: TetR/AcrR family transcriptional regulator [Sphingomonas sp.]|jgi:TetR/AcrR family transcriptional repressor of nem operon|uniref:TetR/AcrR family transcriptional regulator n=1 Tax=Sphingomonas sp. TaxID=28214 RepID=UPI002EDA0369
MRYDAHHKARTRARVLAEASAEILSQGCERVGLATVMARAGLTHGGFYAHFRSKDALVAEAIGHMFDHRYAVHFAPLMREHPATALTRFVDFYVSMAHRDNVEHGCPIPVLSGDVARLSPAARDRFASGVDRVIAWVADRLDALGQDHPHDLAASVMAEAVGAISLARAQTDPDRAERILNGAHRSLTARLGLDGAAAA